MAGTTEYSSAGRPQMKCPWMKVVLKKNFNEHVLMYMILYEQFLMNMIYNEHISMNMILNEQFWRTRFMMSIFLWTCFLMNSFHQDDLLLRSCLLNKVCPMLSLSLTLQHLEARCSCLACPLESHGGKVLLIGASIRTQNSSASFSVFPLKPKIQVPPFWRVH